MARLACVNVPALPLQLLLLRHPEWKAAPVAVVAEDKAQGRILWVNARARRLGVQTGMRYGAGLSLAGDLRGGVVSRPEIALGVDSLTARLQRFSPHVEPVPDEPGVFRVNASGLRRLYRNLETWAARIHGELDAAGFQAAVVVGFSLFGSYAVSRNRMRVTVFSDPAAERHAAHAVPLERLGIAPELRDALWQLGIGTVRDLLTLPAAGLFQRFGGPVYRLHRLASGLLHESLQPVAEALPVEEEILLDYPESDMSRLLVLIKGRCQALLAVLSARRQSLSALHLHLVLEDAPPLESTVKPAAPTRNVALIMDLVRLRLESLELAGGLLALTLLAESATPELEQLTLFAERPKRDLDAAERALARVRAEFGDETVLRARLREGHLPEAEFSWEPLTHIRLPQTALPQGRAAPTPMEESRTLVRRIFDAPLPLPDSPGPLNRWALGRALSAVMDARGGDARSNNGASRTKAPAAPVARLHGPYVVSGGWWARDVQRDYFFAETRQGDVFWIYNDRQRQRWFVQGRVE